MVQMVDVILLYILGRYHLHFRKFEPFCFGFYVHNRNKKAITGQDFKNNRVIAQLKNFVSIRNHEKIGLYFLIGQFPSCGSLLYHHNLLMAAYPTEKCCM